MYWDKPGEQNTVKTLQMAIERAEALFVKQLVVASCSGDTIQALLELKPRQEIICVTHHVGFAGPGVDEMIPSVRRELASKGVQILTTTHLLAGVDRALRSQFNGVYPAEIAAQTLRMLGQGVKVAAEIAVMALDAGLIPHGQEVVSIGGSVSGADSALVVMPAHSNHFFHTEIREIICMPRAKKPADIL